jgi:hypothetical protein
MRCAVHPKTDLGPSTRRVAADIREAFITATVEALLLDLQQFPDLTVDSPTGLDQPPSEPAESQR